MKKGRGKGKTCGEMLNWLFRLAVVSLLAHLWVRGEKMWDVESDTLEYAPSVFLLGFSVGQVGTCFQIQADFSGHAGCWGVQNCSIAQGELPQKQPS